MQEFYQELFFRGIIFIIKSYKHKHEKFRSSFIFGNHHRGL